MQTYNYLANELPRELIEIYNDLQSDVLKIIVRRLKQEVAVERVFQEIQDKVNEYNPQIEKVLQIIFADSKKKSVKDNKKEFKKETEEREPVDNGEANSLIAPLVISALAVTSLLNKKIVNNAVNEYERDYMYIKNSYGNTEKRLSQVFSGLAKKGITIYESYGGGKSKNYSIENMLRRDIMYKVNQANAKVNMQNFKKSSAKFIQVSSHPTARTWNQYMKHPYEDHSSWQGKVYYSRDGEIVEGYEEFESTCGYGEMLGIGGINCYHQFQMNYTGDNTATKYSEEEVERNYALSQQQRAYERAIRQLKQARAVYEEAGDTGLAKNIGKNISMATSKLKDFCEKNDLKYYNWRTQI
jgi:hypothetical protein